SLARKQSRSHGGAAVRVRKYYDRTNPRLSLCGAATAQESRLHGSRCPYSGTRHWREHWNFHAGQCCSSEIAPSAESRTALSCPAERPVCRADTGVLSALRADVEGHACFLKLGCDDPAG